MFEFIFILMDILSVFPEKRTFRKPKLEPAKTVIHEYPGFLQEGKPWRTTEKKKEFHPGMGSASARTNARMEFLFERRKLVLRRLVNSDIADG